MNNENKFKSVKIWMYEWDTDYHNGMDSYDDEKLSARVHNVGYFVTSDESTVFIGEKHDLEKFLKEMDVYDRDNITELYWLSE